MSGRRQVADMMQDRDPNGVPFVQFGCKRGRFSSGNRPCNGLAELRKACVVALSVGPDGVRTLN